MGMNFFTESAISPARQNIPVPVKSRQENSHETVYDIESMEFPSGLTSFEEREIIGFMEKILSGDRQRPVAGKQRISFAIADTLVKNMLREKQ